MARKANPYTLVIKNLKRLQIKADRLNAEIKQFSSLVEAQAKQATVTAKKQTAKVNTVSKKVSKAKAPRKAHTKARKTK